MKKSIILCFTLLLQTLVWGQDTGQSFTLAQAIDFAVKNAYTVTNANTDIEIARKKVAEVRGAGIPQLNAEASFQNFLQVPVSLIQADAFYPSAPKDTYLRLPFGIKYNLSYGYTASWLLFNGEYLVGLQASRSYVDHTKNSLRKSEVEVKESVTKAYYTILILKENQRILTESVQTLDKTLSETEAIYKEGFIEEMDIDRLRLLKTNLSTTLQTLEQQTVLAEKYLKFQMGYEVDKPMTLSDSFDAVLAGAAVENNQELKFDFNASADYQILSSGLKLQELNRKRLMANYLPTLSTFYTWKENRVGNQFDKLTDPNFRVSGGNIFGLNLSVPLFQGLSQRARIQQANLELKKFKTTQTQALQGYSLQSAQALTEYKAALNSFKNNSESVDLAKKIKEKANTKYREGVGSSLELMQSENDLLSAQSNYINSAAQLLNARVLLDKQLNKF